MAVQTRLLGAQAVSPGSLSNSAHWSAMAVSDHERRLYDGGQSHSRCRALVDVVIVKRKVTNIEQANLFLFNPLGPSPSSLSPIFFVQSKKESPPNECECRILLSHASETYATLADDSLLLPVSFTGVRNRMLR